MQPSAEKPHTPRLPGIVIAALRGGAGKTIFSVGIIAALRSRGLHIAPFKKGPDYIDAGWLALAAGRPCFNLDSYLIEPAPLVESYTSHCRNTDTAVIEGNRGLYDCINPDGLTSTAELAKLFNLPVILCIDATKTTRTQAAVVLGCQQFDPQVDIRGVVFNRVAGSRHESILRASIEQYCGIPVLGAVPKLKQQTFPERHMGLVPTYEHQWAQDAVNVIEEIAQKYLDISAIADIARSAINAPKTTSVFSETITFKTPFPDAHRPVDYKKPAPKQLDPQKPVVGIIRDSAFQFYYPENIEALVQAGATVKVTSPLFEDDLPQVDALYIGGGFPETHAARLMKNISYRRQILEAAQKGLPIYAECGGLIYLGQELTIDEGTFTMAGVLPLRFAFSARPQGHGYASVKVCRPNPFYEVGQTIKGHEFHYSKVLDCKAEEAELAFEMERGNGIINQRDGLCRKNVFATYLHIHALGTPQWAPALVKLAHEYMNARTRP